MDIVRIGQKFMTRALALKVGRAAVKKGGVMGIGLAAVFGAGYLAYNLFKKRDTRSLRRIDDIEENNHELEGDKKIVV